MEGMEIGITRKKQTSQSSKAKVWTVDTWVEASHLETGVQMSLVVTFSVWMDLESVNVYSGSRTNEDVMRYVLPSGKINSSTRVMQANPQGIKDTLRWG